MATLSIDKIKNTWIPINVYNKPNNKWEADNGLVLYNDSVNLFRAIEYVADHLGFGSSTVTTEDIQDIVGALFQNSSTINFVYNDSTPSVSASLNLGAIDHNQLLNFVANKHIDHTSVSINSGAGLTGGGDITTSRTLALTTTGVTAGTYGNASTVPSITVDAYGRLSAVASMPIVIDPAQVTGLTEYIQDAMSTTIVAGSGVSVVYNDNTNSLTISSSISAYTDEQARDAVGNILQDTSTINFTYNDASDIISATVITGGIDHNALLNWEANKHIDHSILFINPGTGLSGGGALTTSRTLSIQDTGVVADTYGDASTIPSFIVNSQGQLTFADSFPVSIGANQVTNFNEAVDDRVAALLTAGSNITLTYNDGAGTLTIASTGGGGGTIDGSGAAYRVATWLDSNTLQSYANFIFDGTNLSINTPTSAINSILTTKGITTSNFSWGYSHLDSADNIVFSISDTGYIVIGNSTGTPITIDNVGLSRAADFIVETTSGKIGLYPATLVHVNGSLGVNTSTVGSNKLRVNGSTRIDLGSDATGDIFYRDSSGNLARLGIGSASQVLTGGTIPSWQTLPAGTLPPGTSGDLLVHDGTDFVSVTPIVETQSGITNFDLILAVTPLSYTPLTIFKNGLYQVITDDYTRVGATITFTTTLVSTDKVTVIYYI